MIGELSYYTLVLNLTNNEWRYLENTYSPIWAAYGERVQMEDTFLLSGGATTTASFNTTRNIIEFAPDQERWIIRKEEMTSRIGHAAVLVDRENYNCT